MLKIRLLRAHLNVRVYLKPPLVDWQMTTSGRFFQMLYSELSPDFAINPSDFSINPAVKLNEVCARFNLYSGVNAITLYSDRVAFDFVNLIPTDYPIVFDLMRRVHDAFPPAFNCDFERVETQSFNHFELVSRDSLEDYLKRFESRNDLLPFASVSDFIVEPTARFGVSATDSSWQCRFGVERSVAVPNGLFIEMSMTLRRQSKDIPFLDKLKLAESIGSACRATLGVQLDDDA